jgi:hypothetical protein
MLKIISEVTAPSKGKGKIQSRTGYTTILLLLLWVKEEQRYSSTLSLTSTLDGGGWSSTRPGRFTPGKTQYPLYRRLGWPQSRSGRVRKISLPHQDFAENFSPHRDSIPGPSSPYRVAIPTELSRPLLSL